MSFYAKVSGFYQPLTGKLYIYIYHQSCSCFRELNNLAYLLNIRIWHQVSSNTILLTITIVARNEVALSYHKMRGLYFLAVVFAATIMKQQFIICG